MAAACAGASSSARLRSALFDSVPIMKHCAYCGRENADDAVFCRECGTQEFKETLANDETGASDEADGIQQTMTDALPDLYECLGTYPPYDARPVLEAFLEAGVRYTLGAGRSKGDQATEFGASYGGLTIGVHKEDFWKELSPSETAS